MPFAPEIAFDDHERHVHYGIGVLERMTQGVVADIATQCPKFRVITQDGPPVVKDEFRDARVVQQQRDEDLPEAAGGARDQDAHEEKAGRTCSLKSVSA